jgi:hypothetical protein
MGIFSRKRYWRIGVSAPVYVCAICILIPLLASSFASHNHIVPAHRGRQNDELQRGMYVVVGAFQVPENAIRYAASIQMNGEKAAFGRNDKTGLYYVFFHYSPDDLDYVRSRRTESAQYAAVQGCVDSVRRVESRRPVGEKRCGGTNSAGNAS